MNQQLLVFIESNFWTLLIGFLAVAILTLKLMWKQHDYFYTMGRVRQHFSVLDLQFTATPVELPKLLEGINALEDTEEARRCKDALRKHLCIGFIYMIGIYPVIFLLCIKASTKMEPFGRDLFIVLACAQVIPLICDTVENIYLLIKIKSPTVPSMIVHRSYQGLVLTKWVIACIGVITSISALLYFWLKGDYNPRSLIYVLIILVVTVGSALVGRKKKNLKLRSNKVTV